MITIAGRDRVRPLGGVTAAIGGACLVRPESLARRLSAGHVPAKTAIVRILDRQQLHQEATPLIATAADIVVVGIVVELTDPASMLAASFLKPADCRPGTASRAVAKSTAAAAIITTDRR